MNTTFATDNEQRLYKLEIVPDSITTHEEILAELCGTFYSWGVKTENIGHSSSYEEYKRKHRESRDKLAAVIEIHGAIHGINWLSLEEYHDPWEATHFGTILITKKDVFEFFGEEKTEEELRKHVEDWCRLYNAWQIGDLRLLRVTEYEKVSKDMYLEKSKSHVRVNRKTTPEEAVNKFLESNDLAVLTKETALSREVVIVY